VLYIVLVLVLAALGLLVTALISANSLWAWISIGLSVLAGLILILDWLRRRSQRSAAARDEVAALDEGVEKEKTTSEPPAGGAPIDAAQQTELLPVSGELDVSAATGEVAATSEVPKTADVSDTATHNAAEEGGLEETQVPPARLKADADPGEEPTDAPDLLIISELDDEVVVVDEYPRYHVAECGWLVDRDTIPIGVSEARQLGFSPCVRCGPDAKLAAKFRAKKKSSAGS
jgi:hypothetical protein